MNTTIDNQFSPRDELDWLAFRYISNEMNETETQEFELRLADDLAAQEAVARAVELTHAVVSALDPVPATVAATRQAGLFRRWAIAATAAAALLAVCSFWIGRQFSVSHSPADSVAGKSDPQPGQSGRQVSDEAAVNYVSAWSKLNDVNLNDVNAVAAVNEPIKLTKPVEEQPVEEGEFDWVVVAMNESGADMMMDKKKEGSNQ